MTAGDWEQAADLYITHGDPALPENVALLATVRHEVELERLTTEGRLP